MSKNVKSIKKLEKHKKGNEFCRGIYEMNKIEWEKTCKKKRMR